MHNALEIEDILVEIFRQLSLVQNPPTISSARPHEYWAPGINRKVQASYVAENDENESYEDPETTARRKTLYSLARTCKMFSDPALDQLWAAPAGGLYTVLGLLPSIKVIAGTYKSGRFRPKLDQYLWEGRVSDKDWTTFYYYSRKVREIGYHGYWGWRAHYRIHPSVINALYEHNGRRPLFPNLRFLAWQRSLLDSPMGLGTNPEVAASATKLLHMLVSQTITTLALWHPLFRPRGGFAFDPRYVSSTRMLGVSGDIKIIADACPHITNVLLQAQYETPSLLPLFKCSELQTLIAHTPLPIDALRPLGQLPNLTMVQMPAVPNNQCIDMTTFQNSSRAPDFLPPYSLFPALEDVYLHGDLSASQKILSSCRSHSLHSILLVAKRSVAVPTADIRPCILTLCHPNFAATLQTVHIGLYHEQASRGSQVISFEPTFYALLSLSSLRTLTISTTERIFAITDADLDDMARAWPHLAALSLTYRYHEDVLPTSLVAASAPRLPSLVSFAARCPELEMLFCDAADVGSDDLQKVAKIAKQEARSGRRQMALRGFIAPCAGGWAQVDGWDLGRLACSLKVTFPNVEGLAPLKMVDDIREMANVGPWHVIQHPESPVYQLLVELDALSDPGAGNNECVPF